MHLSKKPTIAAKKKSQISTEFQSMKHKTYSIKDMDAVANAV